MKKFEIKFKYVGRAISFLSGLTSGYCNGKGIDIAPALDYFMKLAPTIAFTSYQSLPSLLDRKISKWTLDYMKNIKPWQHVKISWTLGGGKIEEESSKKYEEFSDSEKKQFNLKISNMEKKLEEPAYITKPLGMGVLKYGSFTAAGYFTGNTLSKFI